MCATISELTFNISTMAWEKKYWAIANYILVRDKATSYGKHSKKENCTHKTCQTGQFYHNLTILLYYLNIKHSN